MKNNDSHPVKLIVGLGNIGLPYRGTRHNAGFMFCDELTYRFGGNFQPSKKFLGDVATTRFGNSEVLVLKPSTLMNLSGQAVNAVCLFYKIKAEEVLVIHDELDLDPGVVKYKFAGGCAGHNGLKSIASLLGTQSFQRIRLGIGHPRNKNLQIAVADYVLSKPDAMDQKLLDDAIAKAISCIEQIVNGEGAKIGGSLK